MELTPRLKLAADFCLPCKKIIDVGCDHAYLCLHLVERGAEEGDDATVAVVRLNSSNAVT